MLLLINLILLLGDHRERLMKMGNFGATIFWSLGFEELKFVRILGEWQIPGKPRYSHSVSKGSSRRSPLVQWKEDWNCTAEYVMHRQIWSLHNACRTSCLIIRYEIWNTRPTTDPTRQRGEHQQLLQSRSAQLGSTWASNKKSKQIQCAALSFSLFFFK